MLIEFSVGNYLSFKDKVTFSMVATDLGAKTNLDEDNTFQVDKELALLKSAAVYGANASGKSNLVQAIAFMCWFVINSASKTQVTDLIDVSEFRLSTETINKPSFFEIVFLLDSKIYRYGFELTKEEVISEWLYYTPTTKEYKYFDRKKQKINILKKFTEGQLLESKTRANALFLSVVAQFNGKVSKQILVFFLRLGVLSGIELNSHIKYTLDLLEIKKYKKIIIKLIKKLDLGIRDIENLTKPSSIYEYIDLLVKQKKNKQGSVRITFDIKTTHNKYDSQGVISGVEKFDMDKSESEGTKKLFMLIGYVLHTLQNGKILLIDELDARLHPLITQSIIELFNSQKTNSNNAQLIFTTHNTNLLTKKLFRPDQIWFTEKDKYEATDLYSLVEYKIDDGASFEDDYIKGKYGAIPYIGNLKDLLV